MLHSCISAGFLVDGGLDDISRNVSIEQNQRAVLVVAVTVANKQEESGGYVFVSSTKP